MIARNPGQHDAMLRSALISAVLPFLLLVTAFLCGGASAGQPVRDVIVQLVAIVVLAAVCVGWIGRAFTPDALFPFFIIAALVLLFFLQLMPLPHSIWAALGGRESSGSVLALIGEPEGMRALSMQPERTVLAALALLPGLAMALAVMRLETPARLGLAWAMVALAGISLLIGAAQVSLGAEAPSITFYTTSHVGLPLGVFSNANHQADFLLIGIVMAGVLRTSPWQSGAPSRFWVYSIMALLAVGVVATGSRAGIALAGVGLVAVAVRKGLSGRGRLFLLGVAGLVTVLAVLILFNPVFARSFADFTDLDDPRFHFWPNVLYAIGHFGWLGTGAGTFDGVYRSVETLETLSSTYVNHAHNDYLEIFLEMGLPGISILCAFIAFVVWRGVLIVRRSDAGPGLALGYAAIVCAGLLLLHSAVDYPLRTPLLGVVFGMCCGLMTRPPQVTGRATVKIPSDTV